MKNIRASINMHKIILLLPFQILLLLTFLSGCGRGHDQASSSLSNLNPHNNNGDVILPFEFKYCNGEAYDLYLSIVHKDITTDPPRETLNGQIYLSDTHGWTLIPASTCITFTKASTNFVRAHNNFFVLRTASKLYIPAPTTFIDYSLSNFEFCLPRNIDLGQTVTFDIEESKYTGLGTVASCGDSNFYVKSRDGLFKVFGFQEGESAWTNGRLDWGRYTFTDGRLVDDPSAGAIGSNNALLAKIRELEDELASEKEKLKGCEDGIDRLVQREVLDLKASDFDPVQSGCQEESRFESFRKKFSEIRQLAKGILNGVVDSLTEIYQEASAAASKLGITEPLTDDIENAGISSLTPPKAEDEFRIKERGFYGRLVQAYLSSLSESMGEKSRNFFTSVLAFSNTLSTFGKGISNAEVIGHNRYYDYTESLETYQKYFEDIDLATGEYGYPVDSPVSSEMRDFVHDELIPLDPAEGMAIENELKTWTGTLSIKRKEMLETLGELIRARIALKKLSSSDESAAAALKLKAITAGLREGLKEGAEFGKCLVLSTVFNDFSDYYAIRNKRDICTGEELTASGQALSGVAIVFGASKVWRELAEQAGFAVRTKSVLKNASDAVDAANKLPVKSVDNAKKVASIFSTKKIELFGGKKGLIKDAVNLDLVAEDGIALDILKDKLKFLPDSIVDEVVTFNPFIPSNAGGTGIRDYLDEAARVLSSGGQLKITGSKGNKFTQLPSQEVLDQLGLETIVAQGPLLAEYRSFVFRRIDGTIIPNDSMLTSVLRKK
jgi:hypothetical protein